MAATPSLNTRRGVKCRPSPHKADDLDNCISK
nr:MAG TPA: hypothetical protein [Caudoviricetes sp.]